MNSNDYFDKGLLRRLSVESFQITLLLGSFAWLFSSPSWEPAIVFLGFLGTKLATVYNDFRTRQQPPPPSPPNAQPPQSDLQLFRRFVRLLEPDGKAVRFLRKHDMGSPFHESMLRPLWEYTDSWEGPSYRYLTSELESARADFDIKVRRFTSRLASETIPCHPHGFFSMGISDIETRSEVFRTQEQLNVLSSDAVEAYDRLYRTGQRLMASEYFGSRAEDVCDAAQ